MATAVRSLPPPRFGVKSVSELISLVRRRFDLITRRDALAALKPVMADALANLEARLSRAGDFTAQQYGGLLAQLEAVAEKLAAEVGVVVEGLQDKSRKASIQIFVQEMDAMQRTLGGGLAPLPIREVARLVGATEGDRSLLERHHLRAQRVKQSYGHDLVREMEKTVASGLASGQSSTEIADALKGTVGGSYWRAERIARTESSFAFNTTHVEAGRELNDEAGDVLMRWVENVDDDTGRPLDERADEDSVAMHGQLRRPGQPFYDPVHKKSVPCPPNRPNDRATLVVWRASWGEPPGGLARLDAESKAAFAQARRDLKPSHLVVDVTGGTDLGGKAKKTPPAPTATSLVTTQRPPSRLPF